MSLQDFGYGKKVGEIEKRVSTLFANVLVDVRSRNDNRE